MKRIYILIAAILFLNAAALCQQSAVRGVWLTNVDSDVLRSREKIIEAVELCMELGFNTIAPVVWNKGVTLYPSKTMKKYFGIEMDTLYSGRDPLKEVIEESHKRGIKVIAWFEFGFSSSFKLNGGHLLAAKPHWKAIDTAGNLVTKNGFEWMNGFHPEVQNFMLSLIAEVVRGYDVDGIQGDDRLPAMPSEAGYDDYTVAKYKKTHAGKTPPRDCKNPEWLQWRADILNAYMGKIYRTVKKIKKNVLVSMAPSIYPWSKEEYLQDWPTWVRQGYVELVAPQLYRYKTEDYRKLLEEIVGTQVSAKNKPRFVPGILLKVGSYYAPEELLRECIAANREARVNGEFFFFYEGVKKYPALFRELYREQVPFPEF